MVFSKTQPVLTLSILLFLKMIDFFKNPLLKTCLKNKQIWSKLNRFMMTWIQMSSWSIFLLYDTFIFSAESKEKTIKNFFLLHISEFLFSTEVILRRYLWLPSLISLTSYDICNLKMMHIYLAHLADFTAWKIKLGQAWLETA